MSSRILFLKKPITLAVLFLIANILGSLKGYSNLVGVEMEIQEITEEVKGLVFSSAIRKIILIIGAGAGIFQSVLSKSIRPLLIWGGVELAICYFPNFFE